MMYGLIQQSLERDRHRAEVAATGDADKIKAYTAAENKEALGMVKLAGSLLSHGVSGGLHGVSGGIKAVKDMWDAIGEQHDIRNGSR
jgi:hypothetical protein